MQIQKIRLGLAAMVLLTSAPIFAQPGRPGGFGRGPGGPGGLELGLGMLEDALDLSESQKTAIKAIRDQARTQSEALTTQLRTGREQLQTAAKANASDAEIDRLIQLQAPTTSQLASIQAKAFRQVWQQLTPEQRSTIDKREEKMKTRMQRRGAERQ